MSQKTKYSANQLHPNALSSCMLVGAGIALILILLFLLSAGELNPAWPKLWIVKPMVIVPFAGAMGGGVHYLMDHFRYYRGWKRILTNALSLIFYIVILWVGMVLGLDGTWWN